LASFERIKNFVIGQLHGAGMSQVPEPTGASTARVRRARRRRKRRLQLFSVEVAEADLQAIAARGYPDVLSDDAVVRSKALEAFVSETIAPL
jgi:hypothetical protein